MLKPSWLTSLSESQITNAVGIHCVLRGKFCLPTPPELNPGFLWPGQHEIGAMNGLLDFTIDLTLINLNGNYTLARLKYKRNQRLYHQ